MPVQSTTKDHDVLRNQYALGYAQLQAASEALLGAPDGEDSDGSEDERIQQQRMKPRSSELIGIGYTPPAGQMDDDGLTSRQESAATQRLRRQLLGKHARPPPGAVSVSGSMLQSGHTAASKPRPRTSVRKEESDDEDEGRASLGKRKGLGKSESTRAPGVGLSSIAEETAAAKVQSTAQTATAAPSKKRGGSYLDQVLADRANKKNKKKRKKPSGDENKTHQ